MLGLSFKPDTDDLRDAPALEIIAGLKRRGVKVRAFDPVAMPRRAGAGRRCATSRFAKDAYDCARGADALVIVTEWNEFRNLDLARLKRLMRRPVLCDLRNIYDPAEVEAAGFRHIGVGRGSAAAPVPVAPGQAPAAEEDVMIAGVKVKPLKVIPDERGYAHGDDARRRPVLPEVRPGLPARWSTRAW